MECTVNTRVIKHSPASFNCCALYGILLNQISQDGYNELDNAIMMCVNMLYVCMVHGDTVHI